MKILHVVSHLPPDKIGGVGQGLWRLHRHMLQAGHESTVITAGTTHGDPTVHRIAKSPAGFVFALRKEARRAREYDVVHCRHGDALPLLLAMKIHRVRTPVLATLHVSHRDMGEAYRPYKLDGRVFGRGWASWKYRNIIARIHRFSDYLVRCVADETSFISRDGAIANLGLKKGSTAPVVYNAVPDRSVTRVDVLPPPTELLYVGTFSHRKRVLALPLILRHVRASVPSARLRLIGGVLDDHPELRSLFNALGLKDSVVCQGRLPSDDIGPFYLASKVLVVPSACEGLPTVILEAYRHGLPCVASRVSGHPEVVADGSSGFLVDRDDPSQMARRCVQILTDPDLQARMGAAARAIVDERFTLERQMSEYLKLYRKLCDRRHRTSCPSAMLAGANH
ncbi:MAG: glycosyltransferase family 4 protein [Phycisphaerae bacterium]